jgi:DNA-binding MarR family transcriptional regulator
MMFDKSYIIKMKDSLIAHIFSEPIIRVVRGLALSPEPLHVREIATRYNLSPAGVSDILKRLKDLGAIKDQRIGNRRCIFLSLSAVDSDCLDQILRSYEENTIRQRAPRLSKRAADKLKWMDQTFILFSKKKDLRDPTKAS